MFHIGRCGSTVLGSLLDQHPQIEWAGEFYSRLFSQWPADSEGNELRGQMPDDPIRLLRRDMLKAGRSWYGFEMKPFHLELIGQARESFLAGLESAGFDHFILLDRRNRLRVIISALLAHQNPQKYHLKDKESPELRKIHVDPETIRIDFQCKSLLDFLQDYDADMAGIRERLAGKHHLELTYEDHIQNDPRIAYCEVCRFLEVEPADTDVALRRTNPFPVRDMIANIGEVTEVLRGTGFEWMLGD